MSSLDATLDIFANQSLSGEVKFDQDNRFEKESTSSGQNARGNLGAIDMAVSFYTNICIALYKGETPNNGRGGRAGLTKFDSIMRGIIEAAAADDPYADQVIYNVHANYINAKGAVADASKFLNSIASARFKNVSARIKQPQNMAQFDVHLRTNIAFQIFWLLRETDEVIRLNLFLKAVHAINEAESRNVNTALSNLFWQIFSPIYQWQHTGVTRANLIANDKVAEMAAQKNEKITLLEGIINGTDRSTFAPDLNVKPNEDVSTPLVTADEQKEVLQQKIQQHKEMINEEGLSQ